MSGFKDHETFDFLKGAELTQISFSRSLVQFIFVYSEQIDLRSAFEHASAATGRTTLYQVNGPRKEISFHPLLGRCITDSVILSDDALRLTFDNGDHVVLLRDKALADSITISKPEHPVIVIS